MKKKLSKCFFSVILITVMLLSTVSAVFAAEEKTVTGNNWLSAIDDNTPITAINIPGTHASATQYINGSIISRTQSLSIPQQLNYGVRFLDIGLEKTENGFDVVHGILSCKQSSGMASENLTASQIIADLSTFLSANPTETVLLKIKEDDKNTGLEFYSSFYDLYIKDNPSLWYTENRIPMLEEVRGKIVLLRQTIIDTGIFNDDNSGIDFSQYPIIPGQSANDFRRADINTIDGEKYASMFVQDSSRLEGEEKWADIVTFLGNDLDSSDFNICMTNGTRIAVPQATAQVINAQFMKIDFQKGRTYGIIATDFMNQDICELIFGTNKSVSVAPRPTTTDTIYVPTLPNYDDDPNIFDDETETSTRPNFTLVLPERTTKETESEKHTKKRDEDKYVPVTNKNGETVYGEQESIIPLIISVVVGLAVFVGSGTITYYIIKRKDEKAN